jgi:hypothetical protein
VLQTRVDSIQKDIAVIFNDVLSPQARSREFARIAGGYINEADANNRRILGYAPMRRVFVDGREGGGLESVKPDGTIAAEWEVGTGLIERIEEMLLQASPYLTGRYRASHRLFADGKEIQFGADVPKANEYVFTNIAPYARKIEGTENRPPQSRKAPDGVYKAIVKQARGVARSLGVRDVVITYSFRTVVAFGGGLRRKGDKAKDNRNPAIVVRYR